MKKRLIILSDLWGKQNANWVKNYKELLADTCDIIFYDSCELAEINTSVYEEERLHTQFVNGGIELAVKNLLKLEERKPISILAFSVGGVIAWKYALINKNVNYLCCISSTRLRYEVAKPTCYIDLLYGTKDTFIPNEKWFVLLGVSVKMIDGFHEVYKEVKAINLIVENLRKYLS
ncbi:Alpha/beta hydrolase [Tenacibaculum sp. 190524A02b]|uniref:Alpha/beta hydrolase n=1 Tax=Tenacibaculum vairaonense TaxID=3137860 RepID=A0ABM9PKP4_9FLAO